MPQALEKNFDFTKLDVKIALFKWIAAAQTSLTKASVRTATRSRFMIFIERVFGWYYLHGGEGREARVLVE